MMTTLQLNSTRFGEIEYQADDVITLSDGMIGFPEARSYLILQHKEGSPFRWFQSIENPALAFLIADPTHFVPDYSPHVSAAVVEDIELSEESSTLVYTVVTIPKGKPEEMTLNLAGPIVINADNRKAKQLVLEDARWPLRYPAVSSGAQQAQAA